MAWIRVCDSADVPVGGLVGREAGGRRLVVWRDATGRPCVMDARCPHQWSDLATDGDVDGDELVCTAHHWRFARDGTGTKRNVRGRRDAKADIEVYPCRERRGRIEADLSAS